MRHAPNHDKDRSLRFLVDGMLGSLATKLRILGFDTIYDKDSSDEQLIHVAGNDHRILVTSDQELFLNSKRKHLKAVLITKQNDRERLLELCSQAGLKRLDLSVMSRCSSCNSKLLESLERDRFGRLLFKCEVCGKLYWRGSHWKKLDLLFSSVNKELRLRNP